MLYRSGDNLESGAINYINGAKQVTLFSAYIKLAQLEKLNDELLSLPVLDTCTEVTAKYTSLIQFIEKGDGKEVKKDGSGNIKLDDIGEYLKESIVKTMK